MSNLTGTVETVEKTVTMLDKITQYIEGIANLVGTGSGYMQAVGLSQVQSHAVIAIIVLVVLLGIFKFLKIVTKVLIFGLVIWIVLSLVGIL